MSELDQVVLVNQHQNTPSDAELDAQIKADEAARHIPDETEKEKDDVADKVENTETHESEPEDDEVSKRISRLAYEAREAKNIAKALQAEIARMRGEAPPLAKDEEINQQVEARARQIAAQQAHNANASAIYAAGVKEYGKEDFDKKLGEWHSAHIHISNEMIEAASEVGDAHKILHWLGKNIDEAERISNLAPHKMGAALAKISTKTAVTVKAQSKAPAPIKPISGKNMSTMADEDIPMEEYIRREDERQLQRRR